MTRFAPVVRGPVLHVVLACVVLVSAFFFGAGAAGAATVPVSRMAAVGDSITSAWDLANPDGGDANHWPLSWSTGTDAAVQSHRTRLGGVGDVQNLAVPGSRWNSSDNIVSQAQSVTAAEYVTILTGSADMCHPAQTVIRVGGEPTEAGIPTPGEYADRLRTTIQALKSANGDVKVLLASIPNWAQLTGAGFAPVKDNLCSVLFGTGGATADPTGFATRLQALNTAEADVCAEFPGTCSYDGGAVYGIVFSPSDLTTYDNFHLTASGQAKIAAATWPTAQALLEAPPPSAPLNTGLPVVSGSAQVGQTLSGSNGTWSGTAPITFARQWRLCDASGSSCTNVSGATGSSYVPVAGDVGKTLRLRVTASNSVTSVSADSAASGVVVAAASGGGGVAAAAGRRRFGCCRFVLDGFGGAGVGGGGWDDHVAYSGLGRQELRAGDRGVRGCGVAGERAGGVGDGGPWAGLCEQRRGDVALQPRLAFGGCAVREHRGRDECDGGG